MVAATNNDGQAASTSDLAPVVLPDSDETTTFVFGVSAQWEEDKKFVVFQVLGDFSGGIGDEESEKELKGIQWWNHRDCFKTGVRTCLQVTAGERRFRLVEKSRETDLMCGLKMKPVVLADWADVWIPFKPHLEKFLCGTAKKVEKETLLLQEESALIVIAYCSLNSQQVMDEGCDGDVDLE